MGVIGIVAGRAEGILVNASDRTQPVTLPEDPGTTDAYSSLTGSMMFDPSFQMSPWETVLFGNGASNTRVSPPPVSPTMQIPPTSPPVPSSIPQQPNRIASPVSPPGRLPSPLPTPVYYSMGFSRTEQGNTQNTGYAPPSFQAVKNTIRLIIVKADPLLQGLGTLFSTVTAYDGSLERYMNSLLFGIIGRMLRG